MRCHIDEGNLDCFFPGKLLDLADRVLREVQAEKLAAAYTSKDCFFKLADMAIGFFESQLKPALKPLEQEQNEANRYPWNDELLEFLEMRACVIERKLQLDEGLSAVLSFLVNALEPKIYRRGPRSRRVTKPVCRVAERGKPLQRVLGWTRSGKRVAKPWV